MFPLTHGVVSQTGGFEADDIAGLTLWLRGNSVYQDTGKVTPAADGDIVRLGEDLSGNANDVANNSSSVTRQAATNNGKSFSVFRGDGLSTGVLNSADAVTWQFLHNGTSWTIILAFRVNTVAANAAYGIIATSGGGSASKGAALWYDNRSAASATRRIWAIQSKGVTGQYTLDSQSDNAVSDQAWHILIARFDSASDFLAIYIDGQRVADTAAQNLPYGTGNPANVLSFLSRGGGANPANMDVAELSLYNQAADLAQLQSLSEAWGAKYGIPLSGEIDSVNSVVPTDFYIVEDTGSYDAFGLVMPTTDTPIIVARRGTGHVESSGVIRQWNYNGGGWSSAQIYNNPAYDDRNVSGGRVPTTGTLIAFVTNYTTSTMNPDQIVPLRSTDQGATWVEQAIILPQGSDTFISAYGPLVELPSGKLLATFVGVAGAVKRVYIMQSTNDGVSWSFMANIHSRSSAPLPTEPALVYVSGDTDANSKLLAIVRETNTQHRSSDGGNLWSSGTPLSFLDVDTIISPWLYKLSDVLYFFWVNRITKRMYYSFADAVAVHDDATAWLSRQTIYNQQAAAGPDFGYPSVVECDGKLHVVFYDDTRGDGKPNLLSSL